MSRIQRAIQDDIREYTQQSFLPEGYVIELSRNRYFAGWERDCIKEVCLQGATCFQSSVDAEQYAYDKLPFIGMELYICKICWLLLVEKEESRFWNGTTFCSDIQQAHPFPGYQEAKEYQHRNRLDNTIIDFYGNREKKIVIAA